MAEEMKAVAEAFTVISQTPEKSMAAATLATLVSVPESLNLLCVLATHPEVFTVSEVPPLFVRLARDVQENHQQQQQQQTTPVKQGQKKQQETGPPPDHVLEFTGFAGNEGRKQQLDDVLRPYLDSMSVTVEWADANTADAVFCDSATAQHAIAELRGGDLPRGVRIVPFSEASVVSKELAAKSFWGHPVSAPAICPKSGTVGPGAATAIPVTIKCDTKEAAIHFTTNGTVPTLASAKYTGPIIVERPMTICAKAFKPSMISSKVATSTYTGPQQQLQQQQQQHQPQPQPPQHQKQHRQPQQETTTTTTTSAPAPAATAGEPRPPHVIAFKEFVIEDGRPPLMSQGGYAVLYFAKHRQSPVCVRMPEGLATDKKTKETFLGDTAILTGLRHPNIVQLLGVCSPPDPYCIVTEQVEGCPLSMVIINPAVHLMGQDRYSIALDIARGMSFLHGHRIAHLNLNPTSVIVSETGSCKISECGIAAMAKKLNLMPISAANPAFIAPETLLGMSKGGSTAELAGDVFSFGMLMWFILTRQMPFEGMTTPQIVAEVAHGKGRPKIPCECEYEYGRIMSKCWKREPEARPSFDRVVEKLENLIGESTAQQQPGGFL